MIQYNLFVRGGRRNNTLLCSMGGRKMADYCSYTMKVAGELEKVNSFLAIMEHKDSHGRFFIGASMEEYSFEEENSNAEAVVSLCGECKYSAYGSLCPGDLFDEYVKEHSEEQVTNLQIESERLSLYIEFYSFFDGPPGEGFAEHGHYKDGNEIVYEDTDYCEVWYDPDSDGPFEEFREEAGLPDDVTEDMFEDGVYSSGGYEVEFAIDGHIEPEDG